MLSVLSRVFLLRKFPLLFSFILVNVASLFLFIVNDVEILLCRVIAYTDKKKSKVSRPNEDKAVATNSTFSFPFYMAATEQYERIPHTYTTNTPITTTKTQFQNDLLTFYIK